MRKGEWRKRRRKKEKGKGGGEEEKEEEEKEDPHLRGELLGDLNESLSVASNGNCID